jgi:hypothetical protein
MLCEGPSQKTRDPQPEVGSEADLGVDLHGGST